MEMGNPQEEGEIGKKKKEIGPRPLFRSRI
jgi:hypothetical protein